ncbi:MAG: hypothetical protein ACPGF7_00395 [Pontibacterium sp.]
MTDSPKFALLLADRSAEELSPLDQLVPAALLPIAGKTPLEYWLETIYEMNIREAWILISGHSPMIRERLADGAHWGVKLHYLSSTGESSIQDLLTQFGCELPQSFQVGRADTLPSHTAENDLRYFIAVDQDNAASIAQAEILNWTQLRETDPDDISLLRRFSDIPAAARRVLSPDYPLLWPRGIEAEPGKWLATPHFNRSRLQGVGPSVYVGRDSMVHRHTTISGDLFVESGSYIDQNSSLDNAYIFPDTYVGQHVSVHNALVCGSFLIDLNNNLAQHISDPALISHVEPSSTLVRTEMRERVIAALLIVLSAPVALLLALLTRKTPGPLLQDETYASNRSSRRHPLPFELKTFNSNIGWVRRWPQLLNVLDGDLKLFGSPLERPDSDAPVLDLSLCQGLYHPQDLFSNHEFDSTEAQLWGLELASEKAGYGRILKRVFTCVFNRAFRANKVKPEK